MTALGSNFVADFTAFEGRTEGASEEEPMSDSDPESVSESELDEVDDESVEVLPDEESSEDDERVDGLARAGAG